METWRNLARRKIGQMEAVLWHCVKKGKTLKAEDKNF